MSVIWFYVQAVLIILAAAIGLALNVTVTEFVDTVCSRHILACMTPSYNIGIISCKKNNFRLKISRMSNNGKAKFFYHEIMVVWHNTVLQCGQKNIRRGQVNIFWHVLRVVYCLLGPKILVTPLQWITLTSGESSCSLSLASTVGRRAPPSANTVGRTSTSSC